MFAVVKIDGFYNLTLLHNCVSKMRYFMFQTSKSGPWSFPHKKSSWSSRAPEAVMMTVWLLHTFVFRSSPMDRSRGKRKQRFWWYFCKQSVHFYIIFVIFFFNLTFLFYIVNLFRYSGTKCVRK